MFVLILATVAGIPAKQNPEHELRIAEDTWAQAAIGYDSAALQRILADDLTYTHASGRTETKSQFIQSIATGQMKYESAELEELTVKDYGKIAVVLSVRRMRSGLKGEISSFRVRFQRVWVKRAGRWQLAAHQATRIPE